MAELNWRVEDRRRSKMALLPSLVGQKCGEDWLIQAAWTLGKSDIVAERLFSSIYLRLNKFSGLQDCQLLMMASRLQNHTTVYR